MSEPLDQKNVDQLMRRAASGGRASSISLTQREIDAILLRTTPMPLASMSQEDVQSYNFSRPPRVSRDRRGTLESIYARFALSVQALLSSLLRTPMDVVFNGVEQAMFSEYVLSLGTPCASFTFEVGPRVGGEGALDLSTEFAFHLVDRLFGGTGDTPSLARPLTPLEQTVVRSVADRLLSAFREAWAEHLPVAPKLIAFESNPDMLTITSREDNVLVANLELRSAGFNGLVAMCLPMSSLEAFLQEKSTSRTARGQAPDAAESRRRVEESLQHAHLDVAARFPTLWVSARTLASLAPGQVLHTGQASDEPVEVHVNDRLRFTASLGQMRRQLGLRIVERVVKPVAERPLQTRQGRLA